MKRIVMLVLVGLIGAMLNVGCNATGTSLIRSGLVMQPIDEATETTERTGAVTTTSEGRSIELQNDPDEVGQSKTVDWSPLDSLVLEGARTVLKVRDMYYDDRMSGYFGRTWTVVQNDRRYIVSFDQSSSWSEDRNRSEPVFEIRVQEVLPKRKE